VKQATAAGSSQLAAVHRIAEGTAADAVRSRRREASFVRIPSRVVLQLSARPVGEAGGTALFSAWLTIATSVTARAVCCSDSRIPV